MNKHQIAAIIQDYLKATNQNLSQDAARKIAGSIARPMWQWHIYIGCVLVGLFSLRFLLPLFGEMKFPNPFEKSLSLKERFQKWIYLIFYLCIIVTLTTGLLIEFGHGSIKKLMEKIHGFSIYYMLAFIFVPIGGVLLAELTNQQGIISRIVSGKQRTNIRSQP
jgi:hypothetical protein